MFTPRYATIAAALSVFLAVGCQTAPPAEPAELSEADRTAIGDASAKFRDAFLAGDEAALAALYTEDAVTMPPNAPAASGRAAIQAAYAQMPPISSMEITDTEIIGTGDTVTVIGTYTMTMSPEGAAPINDVGKYMDVRKKQADGTWLLYRDTFNSDLPAAPPPPEAAK